MSKELSQHIANNHKHTNICHSTYNDDSVYLDITFNKSKQSKRAPSNINESNGEISTVIGAVVTDTHQRTPAEKRCFWLNTATKITTKKIVKQRFAVGVRPCISIATALMTLKISLLDSLILVIALLDWFHL